MRQISWRKRAFLDGRMMLKALKRLWKIARYASGDDAYERYLHHLDQAHADEPPLSRKAFWDTELDRKWNGLRRCC
jgi:uncharacterized short protein YbdD (DUF466 family)